MRLNYNMNGLLVKEEHRFVEYRVKFQLFKREKGQFLGDDDMDDGMMICLTQKKE